MTHPEDETADYLESLRARINSHRNWNRAAVALATAACLVTGTALVQSLIARDQDVVALALFGLCAITLAYTINREALLQWALRHVMLCTAMEQCGQDVTLALTICQQLERTLFNTHTRHARHTPRS